MGLSPPLRQRPGFRCRRAAAAAAESAVSVIGGDGTAPASVSEPLFMTGLQSGVIMVVSGKSFFRAVILSQSVAITGSLKSTISTLGYMLRKFTSSVTIMAHSLKLPNDGPWPNG